MSGIVGVVHLDDTPVDQRLLQRMTVALGHRGPDGQRVWSDGPVGLGHTLFLTTTDLEPSQPLSLDGNAWIVADARIDGRGELIRKLEARGRNPLRAASDAALILHAYDCWGEDSVEHLLGDFAFAIWDRSTRRLFCARDHFGVKPFYYAHVGGRFVFSNTLECVRLHPAVGDALDELAVADFLLFGSNQDPRTTTFADVRRLEPGHSLTCREGVPRRRRYWTLPHEDRIRYRRSREFVDRFLELFRIAVSDRLRTGPVGIWMSGGLDSTSIAATARHLRSAEAAPFGLRAQTTVYDALIPDQERRYATMAADALGIEIDIFAADHDDHVDGRCRTGLATPEPSDNPFVHVHSRQLGRAAAHSRVILSGDGADEVLWGSTVAGLLGRMRPGQLAADVARTLLHRRRPALGLRAMLTRSHGSGARTPAFPEWISHGWAARLRLHERWQEMHARRLAGDHPLRPEAYGRLMTALWSRHFEVADPGSTRIPLECRYPFLDVRLVSYLLALPPLPWCIDKHILRVAMRGHLPDAIRLRAKAPLAGDPLRATLLESGERRLDLSDASPNLLRFVDRKAMPIVAGGRDEEAWRQMRLISLNQWLEGVSSTRPLEELMPQ
jgi:asparagine synthase (glutamine-hydrolysing)